MCTHAQCMYVRAAVLTIRFCILKVVLREDLHSHRSLQCSGKIYTVTDHYSHHLHGNMGKEETAVNKHTSFFCCVSSGSSSIISSAPVAFLISVPATSVPPIGPLHWRLPPPGMLPALPPPHPTSFSPLGLRGAPSYCLRQSLFSPLPSSLGAPSIWSSKAVSTLETHLLISFFN